MKNWNFWGNFFTQMPITRYYQPYKPKFSHTYFDKVVMKRFKCGPNWAQLNKLQKLTFEKGSQKSQKSPKNPQIQLNML